MGKITGCYIMVTYVVLRGCVCRVDCVGRQVDLVVVMYLCKGVRKGCLLVCVYVCACYGCKKCSWLSSTLSNTFPSLDFLPRSLHVLSALTTGVPHLIQPSVFLSGSYVP